jgi:hypothetical protein
VHSSSCSEFGVLDKVLSASLFNNGIDEGVELDEVVNLVLNSLECSCIRVEIDCLSEEFSAETLVRVNVDSVFVAVVSS